MSRGREESARAGGGGSQLKKDKRVATASCVFLFAKLLQIVIKEVGLK